MAYIDHLIHGKSRIVLYVDDRAVDSVITPVLDMVLSSLLSGSGQNLKLLSGFLQLGLERIINEDVPRRNHRAGFPGKGIFTH